MIGCSTGQIEEDATSNKYSRFITLSGAVISSENVVYAGGDGRVNEEIKLMISNKECYFDYYKKNIFVKRLNTECAVTKDGRFKARVLSPFDN